MNCTKDDPYELYNLYDSERTIADEMLEGPGFNTCIFSIRSKFPILSYFWSNFELREDLRQQSNTITETAVVTDEISSDDPNFPVNTGFATTGWCTTNDQ